MSVVSVEHVVDARVDDVWDALADYGNIHFFNPNLVRATLLTKDQNNGVGARRRCEMKDGKNYIDERVVEWVEGSHYTVEVYEGTMPLKEARVTLRVESLVGGGTRVSMKMKYTMKYGPLGSLMDALMMRRMMRGMLMGVLRGLESYVVRGERVERQAA